MKSRGVTFLIVTLLGAFCSVTAQDFMLQGWYWNFPKTAEGKVWADSLKDKAAELHTAGFTHVWVPPFTRTSSGSWSNGYDPKDLFDLGEFGQGATHFGTRTDVNEMITAFNNQSITTIADVVFNHRDGGKPERNTAVRGWIDNYNSAKVNNGDLPYPSDRFRYILPIGASTGRGAGNYYFKISSASGHSNFHNYQYRLYMWTNRVGWQNLADTNEVEPNGGGNCSQGNNTITLGRGWLANVDSDGCTVDEFHLSLASTDFNSAGDTIYIELRNTGGYSDHRIFGLWDGANSQEIVSQLELQTYTDFTSLPSGRGGMNYLNFKPNGNATCLCGDEDFMYFYYDYDQYQNATKDTLYAWAKWLWQDVGIRGYRMDAVKHFPTWFVGDLMDYLHDNSIDPGIVVGEHYTSDATTLNNWVNSVLGSMDNDTKAAIDVRIFDFSLRQALENASDSYGYDVRNVFGASLVDAKGTSPFNVITFANNHDFRDAGQPIDNDPILAYAYLLTNNQLGVPCVYYPDYYSLGIKAKIDTLMSIHKNYIYGATSREYLGRNGTTRYQSFLGGYANTSLVYQLMNTNSGHDVIVAINYAGGTDTLRLYQELNMTNLAQGDSLRDKTGNSTSPVVYVDANNRMYIEVPPRSYAVYIQNIASMPVELQSFGANSRDSKVELNWNTVTETNNYGFEIQRQTEKEKNWNKIGFVTGAGNSNSVKKYSFVDRNVTDGVVRYRLKQIDFDGQHEYSKEIEVLIEKKYTFGLEQNYPNPFNPTTVISYNIAKKSNVKLSIYNQLGELVAKLVNRTNEAGNYKVEWNAGNLASGVYLYVLEAEAFPNGEKFREAKKLLVIK